MRHIPNREDNFSWLLAALVSLPFFSALFTQLNLPGARHLVNMSLIFTVIIAVWAMQSSDNKWFNHKLILSIIILIMLIIDSATASDTVVLAELITLFIFVAATTYMAWQQVMFTGEITRNTILGSICIYFLLGMLFGFAYLIVEAIFPGSMHGLESDSWQQNLSVIIYYSMVTLTTLGYGDITPAAPLTRFMAYIEAITGIFYTTVLVASLIGMRLSSYGSKNSK